MVKFPKAAALATAVGGAVLFSTAAVGTAAAQDLTPVINTTCSYPQAVAALNAHDPAAAGQLAETPMAQAWLQQFLASPTDQRVQLAQQVQAMPGSQQYVGLVLTIAQTCSNF